jgi:acylphosphatase
MSNDQDCTLTAIVTGRVQGVGFRLWVYEYACQLGLRGWVRNLPDGNVEVVAQGSDDALASLRARIRKGPPFSRVTDVIESWRAREDLPTEFEARY